MLHTGDVSCGTSMDDYPIPLTLGQDVEEKKAEEQQSSAAKSRSKAMFEQLKLNR